MKSIHSESGKYSFLWDLSDEELERLLQQEFIASDDRELDEDYFMAIVEVMKSREEMTPEDQEETKAAWENFQENYMGQSAAYESVPLPESESSTNNQINSMPKKRPPRRMVRLAIIAAAIVCILCGVASANGWFQIFVTWTTETFSFVSPKDKQDTEILSDDPYADLRSVVEDYTNLSIVPTWAPEGTVGEDGVRVFEHEDVTIINCTYSYEGKAFIIMFRMYETMPEKFLTQYEQSDQPAYHEHDGIQYYIMPNNSTYTAVWYNDGIEATIQGQLTYEDLIEMVDSI